MEKAKKPPVVLSLVLAGIMLMQSALGLLFREQYKDAGWIKLSWFGNDWITLLLAVPLLVFALFSWNRGKTRGFLLWLGLVGYTFYNNAFYLFGAALNVFFPFYVASLVISVFLLLITLPDLDSSRFAARFRTNTPHRLVGGYLTFVGSALGIFWLIFWACYAFAGRPTPVEPDAFKVVAAVDLTTIITLLVSGGILLWLKKPWGFILATAATVQGTLYLSVLSLNSILMIREGLADSPGELPLWGSLLITMAAAALIMMKNVRRDDSA